MNREEAIAYGREVHDIKHSMKRRNSQHDYYRKGTYMLTLVVEGRKPLLGKLKGEIDEALNLIVTPEVELSQLGATIFYEEKQKITRFYPMVEVWKMCIMPDHIHMIVRVKDDMPKGKHLGMVVKGFKTGCSRAWWALSFPASGETEHTRTAKQEQLRPVPVPSASASLMPSVPVPSVSPEGSITVPQLRPVLFEPGYNDKILFNYEQLNTWKAYLDDNPRRLLIKRKNPHLFTVLSNMEVAGRKCQIVGNRFLFDIPDKMAVIVHRRYTDEENARLREEWLACGERGGVLVSAAISPKEKEVLREAMNRRYRIILLRENGFPQFYKPSGESFDACFEGLLLQVSPWEYHTEKRIITREQCLELNAMAEKIAEGSLVLYR